MTATMPGARHRAACRPTTPFTTIGQAVAGPAARRGMLVAASSGLALTMAASTAVAAPEGSSLPQVDVSALSSQARTALTVNPTVSVPADVEFAVADVAVAATPPKTTVAEDSDPIAEHVAAEEAAEAAATAAAEAEALAAARSTETASRSGASSTSASTAAVAEESATQAAPAPAASGNAIVDIAYRYVGTPYVWGGASPSGFDCSGFTWYVFQQAGISIPRSSSAQAGAGTVVSAAEARPGDLVWWPGHIGIYLGDGQHIAARNPSKPLQAGPISHVGRGAPTFIRVG
ncbi:Cell wall-associated hydrolase, NlpC family [Georgenia satyanarayanai]|uniref:Cell wall-associated hydrolase, NlpC family n=1 Tax=Georgenia satyanarayanai TaxID=860221 RepID=A0A2Y9A3X3_9MICO|nr:C40 family peptidase [Georgenia satyanarayanai]PYG00962.1 cell wall-associated NlpC family hydrolase [Georgenia satyanarayanai]SSA39201.1 Cell wall-associated hydrolase, NlpC family [Georgenia satyanarayanai]